LCEALRRYVFLQPQAADSLAGIRQWWLPESLRDVPAPLLREAVEVLVDAGEMHRTVLPDGTELFARDGR
jgi:hypothetical protein